MQKKIWKNVKDNSIVLLASVIVIIGMALFFIVEIRDNIPQYATYLGHRDEEQFVYSLSNDDVIVQEFSSPHDFEFATIHFSNHERIIDGKTFILTENVTMGEVIDYQELDNKDISYNKLVEIPFINSGIKDEAYRITISFEGMGEMGLGIFGYEAESSYLDACSISDEYAVAIGTHEYTNVFNAFIIILFVYLILFIIWSVFVFQNSNWREETRFLAIAIPMGIFFLSFFHNNPVYDGDRHIFESIHYSNVILRSESEYYPKAIAMTENERSLLDLYDREKYNYHEDNSMIYEWKEYTENFHIFSHDNAFSDDYIFKGATYNPSFFEYFPAVIAITLSRILRLNICLELLMAKGLMLAFYIAVCFYAIKIVPCKKTLLAFVALIPMCIYESSGITYDAVLNALGVLMAALFIKGLTTKLQKIDYIAFGSSCFVIARNKGATYLILIFIFLCMPRIIDGEKIKRLKLWIIGGISGLVGLLPTFKKVYWGYFRNLLMAKAAGAPDKYYDIAYGGDTKNIMLNIMQNMAPDSQYIPTFEFVISHPFGMAKWIVKSFFDQADKLLGKAIGNRMAWTDEETSWVIILSFVLLLLFAAIQNNAESDDFELSGKLPILSRIWILALFGIEIAIFYIVMAMTETGIYDATISGVQGRYFLPWFAVVLLTLTNQRIKIDSRGIRIEYFMYSMFYVAYAISFLGIFFY